MKINGKKFIKIGIKVIIRLVVCISIIILILLIINFIISEVLKKDVKKSEIYKFYYNINRRINNSISEKLNLGLWDYDREDYTIKIGTQEIKEKGEKKRILVVGDSFVWGYSQDNLNNLWWKQLEYIFKKNGYENIEVIAAGMNGFSIVDETEKILQNEEYIEKISPDLVIVGFVSNDWEINDEKDAYYKNGIKEFYGTQENEYIESHFNNKIISILREKFNAIYEVIIELLMKKEYAKQKFKEEYGYSYEQMKILYASEEYTKRIIERGILPISNYKIPIFITNLHYNSKAGNSNIEFKDKIFKLLDEYGIENYDLEEMYNEEFKNNKYEELMVNIADYHPGARLMSFYAQNIYKYIEENHKDILGKKEYTSFDELEINDYLPYNINLKKIDDKEYTLCFPRYYEKLLQNYNTKESYIKLNLKYPVNIEKIELEVESCNITSVKVDVYDEEKGYEAEYDIELNIESIEENKRAYSVNTNRKVTSIKISADSLKEQNCPILLRIK